MTRSMTDAFKKLTFEDQRTLKKAPFPAWYPPMLATLTDKRFSDSHWIYEPKFDGERALTFYHDGKATIFSRNQINLNERYPEIVSTFNHQECENFVIDGEIVAFEKGGTSFSKLQQRLGVRAISLTEAQKIPVYYYLFDILYLKEFDVRDLSLRARKTLLQETMVYQDPLRLTPGVIEHGEAYYSEACKKRWEGIIAKRLDSLYQGKRSQDWLKFKRTRAQEFIIRGFTAPKGSRKGFGALLVGYYDEGKLHYAGKVGTGFNKATLLQLRELMDTLKIPQSPFVKTIKDKNITWVQPKLVAQIGFTEWTKEGKLRHPHFKGLRDDKKAIDVVRESGKG